MAGPFLAHVTETFGWELESSLDRIKHCVGQLTDEQVWSRERTDTNSVGNLVLHLTGNVKQMIVSSIGGEADDRNRPAEFAARDAIPKAELLRKLSEVVTRAKAALSSATADELLRVRTVNNTDLTGLQSVVRSVAHFRGHTQEIIHVTRTLLGDRYRYAGPR
jgi:hypothetical protein